MKKHWGLGKEILILLLMVLMVRNDEIGAEKGSTFLGHHSAEDSQTELHEVSPESVKDLESVLEVMAISPEEDLPSE